jgi:hypothetical protein
LANLEPFKEIYSKNKRSFIIWGFLIFFLLVLLVIRPGKKAMQERQAELLKGLDTTSVEWTVKMAQYQKDYIEKKAKESGQEPGAYIGNSICNVSTVTKLKESVKALAGSVTDTIKK